MTAFTHITSAANAQVKDLKSLLLKKHREESELFLVEGAQHIADAQKHGWETAVLTATPEGLATPEGRQLAETCKKTGGRIFTTTREILGRITDRDNAQDTVAALRQKIFPLDGIGDAPVLSLALEDIRDPGNLGTILRTAAAVGVENVLLVGQTCDPFSPEAVRATTGAFARIRVIRTDAAGFAAWRKGWKGRIIGTHLQATHDYRTADYTLPALLLMGSEQAGLSGTLAALCDARVKIPMPGGTESLNLAVATGVMLYELSRARI
jgi:TrmH family RNA methyltransferase